MFRTHPPPITTLFPYTTLFRSYPVRPGTGRVEQGNRLDLGPSYVLEFRMYLAEPHLYFAVAPAELPDQVSASSLLGYALDLQVPSSQLLLGSVEHCFVSRAVSLLVHYARHQRPSEV